MTRGIALLLAAATLTAAIVVAQLAHPYLAARVPLPVIEGLGGNFRLVDTDGRTVQLTDYQGRGVLLTFGFTTCADVCPTLLARMRHVLDVLGEDATAVQPIFVTLDPQRDTGARLADYVRYFHPAFVGLRGDATAIREAADRFKVYYEQQPLPPPLEYGIAHSDQIYLLDRAGRVRATFANNVTVEAMASSVQRLLAE